MKVCIVSDSHDHRPLLEAAVRAAKQQGAEAVLHWLASRPDVSKVVAIGHSLGASLAAELAAHDPDLDL